MQRLRYGAGMVWSAVQRLTEAAIIALSLVMVASLAAQVGARYIFNAPLTWSEELARYVFIWLSFLGGWLAWARREHLGIDLLSQTLPPRLRWLLLRLCEIIVVAFAIAAMVFGKRILEISVNQPSAVLRLPMAWVYLAFYVGMTLIVVQTLADWLSGRPDRDAAPEASTA